MNFQFTNAIVGVSQKAVRDVTVEDTNKPKSVVTEDVPQLPGTVANANLCARYDKLPTHHVLRGSVSTVLTATG